MTKTPPTTDGRMEIDTDKLEPTLSQNAISSSRRSFARAPSPKPPKPINKQTTYQLQFISSPIAKNSPRWRPAASTRVPTERIMFISGVPGNLRAWIPVGNTCSVAVTSRWSFQAGDQGVHTWLSRYHPAGCVLIMG